MKINNVIATIVSQSEVKKTDKGSYCSLIIEVPGLFNSDGDPVTKAESFSVWAGSKIVEEFNLESAKLENWEARFDLYVNPYESKDTNGNVFYNTKLNVAKLILRKAVKAKEAVK